MQHPGRLPRLDPHFYRGLAVVHWCLPTFNRRTGWLNDHFHLRFRELLLHAGARERLLCPIYCLMPDHIHLVWMGLRPTSDQRRAMTFLRTQARSLLFPARFQPQAFDHVLRECERTHGAFARTVQYIAENPVRAGLVLVPSSWEFRGCMIPGYPTLCPLQAGYWEVFWKIHAKCACHSEA